MTEFEKWINDKACNVDDGFMASPISTFMLRQIQKEAFEAGQRHPICISTIDDYQHKAEQFGRAATRAIDRGMKKLWLHHCEYFKNKIIEEKHKEKLANDANMPVLQ